jgi:hypothetical protein
VTVEGHPIPWYEGPPLHRFVSTDGGHDVFGQQAGQSLLMLPGGWLCCGGPLSTSS